MTEEVKTEEKNKGGRPTVYSEEMLIKANEYIDKCIDEIEEYHKTRGKKSDTYERRVRVKLPTIEGLAVYLGITRETVYAWEKEEGKEQFSYILARLRAEQAQKLIDNGLSGDYNPTIAKVLLTKHGYREGLDQTTDGKALPTPILQLNNVHTDDSNRENHQTEEEN